MAWISDSLCFRGCAGIDVLSGGRSRLRPCLEYREEDSPDGNRAPAGRGAVEAIWLV